MPFLPVSLKLLPVDAEYLTRYNTPHMHARTHTNTHTTHTHNTHTHTTYIEMHYSLLIVLNSCTALIVFKILFCTENFYNTLEGGGET